MVFFLHVLCTLHADLRLRTQQCENEAGRQSSDSAISQICTCTDMSGERSILIKIVLESDFPDALEEQGFLLNVRMFSFIYYLYLVSLTKKFPGGCDV